MTTVKIEIVKHAKYYYWLVDYGAGHNIEGFAETLEQAMKEIMQYENGAQGRLEYVHLLWRRK